VNPSRAGTTTSTRRSSGASACCSARARSVPATTSPNPSSTPRRSSTRWPAAASLPWATPPRTSNSRGPVAASSPGSKGDGAAATWTRANTTNRITSLVRKAALGRLTLPCEIEGAERALLVMAGPSQHLNRKGIERGRKWLEEQTGSMEVRGGDYPTNEPRVAAAVLLSGIHNVPRIKGAPADRHRGPGQHRRHPPAERGQPRTAGRR